MTIKYPVCKVANGCKVYTTLVLMAAYQWRCPDESLLMGIILTVTGFLAITWHRPATSLATVITPHINQWSKTDCYLRPQHKPIKQCYTMCTACCLTCKTDQQTPSMPGLNKNNTTSRLFHLEAIVHITYFHSRTVMAFCVVMDIAAIVSGSHMSHTKFDLHVSL